MNTQQQRIPQFAISAFFFMLAILIGAIAWLFNPQ
jgi:hypothetical protein